MSIEQIDEERREGPRPSTSATSASATACGSRARQMRTSFTNLLRAAASRPSGPAGRHLPVVHGESLAVIGPNGGQEHAPAGPGRHHPALDGRGRGRRPHLEPADAWRRLRRRAGGAGQHPPGWRVWPADSGGRTPIAGHRRLRRLNPSSMPPSRPTVGMRAPSASPSRPPSNPTSCCSTRSWRPATPTPAKSKARVLELVREAGDRPGDPRYGVGDRILQPGHPPGEGPHRGRGRAQRGRQVAPGALGATQGGEGSRWCADPPGSASSSTSTRLNALAPVAPRRGTSERVPGGAPRAARRSLRTPARRANRAGSGPRP